jgi:hypothetical protein
MIISDFAAMVRKLSAYFERRDVSEVTLDLWVEKCSAVPPQAIPWIISQFCERQESWPRNIPGAIMALFSEWKHMQWTSRQPELLDDERQRLDSCPDCRGAGYLILRRRGEPYSYAFRCGACKRDQTSHAIPCMRLSEAYGRGFTA